MKSKIAVLVMIVVLVSQLFVFATTDENTNYDLGDTQLHKARVVKVNQAAIEADDFIER